jgi:hypothetical protein
VRNNSQTIDMSPVSDGAEPEGSAGRWLERMVSKVRRLMVSQVPEGYQDDRGFHFGRPSQPLNQ